MMLLLTHLAPAIGLALALGAVFAALGGPGRRLPSAGRALPLAALAALAVLVGVAALGLVPGQPGLWLDIALPLALAYAAGALAGTGLRRRLARRPPEDEPSLTPPDDTGTATSR